MKRSIYRERDYAFGQTFLALRTTIGLTQAELARRLGVSRKAVGEWEAGENYPTAEHLKAVIALAVGHQVWPAGREEAEIRAFWQAAHQKILLDEAWLGTLLSDAQAPGDQTSAAAQAHERRELRLEWGDALAVTSFYGREWELDLLSAWGDRGALPGGQRAGAGWYWQVGPGDAGDAPRGAGLRGGHLAFLARCPHLRSTAG
jgi:transcriptional regulator with XRE-family HTH domain